MRPPRPFTAPNGPQSGTAPIRPVQSCQSMDGASDSASDASSDSDPAESDSGDSQDSSSSSESQHDVKKGALEGSLGQVADLTQGVGDDEAAMDQLPDRCLRPLSKLQQSSFMPAAQAAPAAESHGLVWQNSGFMTPFTPELLGLKREQSRQTSTAVTGMTAIDAGDVC